MGDTTEIGRLEPTIGPETVTLALRVEGRTEPVLAARLGLEAGGATLWSDGADEVLWEGDGPGEIGPGSMAAVRLTFARSAVEWSVWFELASDGRTLLIGSSVANTGPAPVRLGRCDMLSGSLRLGGAAPARCCYAARAPPRPAA